MEKQQIIYKPIQFITITFIVTWICAFFKAYQTWFSNDSVIFRLADFLESVSPLLAALILWRKTLFVEGKLFVSYSGSGRA